MNKWEKLFLYIISIVGIVLLSFVCYNQFQQNDKQKAIETSIIEQKQLSDNIIRSSNNYIDKKDLETYLKDQKLLTKDVLDDISKLRGEVQSYSQVKIVSVPVYQTKLPSTSIGEENPNPQTDNLLDPYNHLRNKQILRIDEKIGILNIPFGEVGFSGWEENPWSLRIPQRTYKLNTIQVHTEDDRIVNYNQFVIGVEGSEYILPIESSSIQQVYPDSKFSYKNPRFFLSLHGGLSSVLQQTIIPNISFTTFSYGQYDYKPKYYFAQLALGYDLTSKNVIFGLKPISYNINSLLPVLKNTYVEPMISISTNKDILFTIGISTPL